jgi:hypothetical protein
MRIAPHGSKVRIVRSADLRTFNPMKASGQNSSWTRGELAYPRQRMKDRDVPLGDLLKYESMAAQMQVSRTLRLIFEFGRLLRGVGEALKHGIARG